MSFKENVYGRQPHDAWWTTDAGRIPVIKAHLEPMAKVNLKEEYHQSVKQFKSILGQRRVQQCGRSRALIALMPGFTHYE